MASFVCRKYLVSGRVQRVGYRYFARRAAVQLGVRGWTRNLSDGRVEVFAAGTRQRLEVFERELRIGPDRAEVADVVVEDAGVADVKIEGFSIR